MAEGKVPGRDQRGHPDRLAPELDLGVGQVRGDALDVRPLGFFGVELDEGGGIVDLAARLGDRLALLEGHDPRQVVLVGEDQLEPGAQERAAGLREAPRPARKGGMGGLDGVGALAGRKARDVADRGAGGRVGHGDRRAVARRAPAAVHVGEAAKQRAVVQSGHQFVGDGVGGEHRILRAWGCILPRGYRASAEGSSECGVRCGGIH
jgi:hypothetical protein